MKQRSAVVGSSNTDLVIRLKRLPRSGETVLGGTLLSAGGGKGANQAVAAARAGGSVSLVARVGRDAYGDSAIAAFEHDGIDVTHVTRDRRAPSGAALIFVDEKGQNSIAVASGANAQLSVAHVTEARAAIARAKVLLVQLETPLSTVLAAAFAASKGTLVILNPAPARALPDALLRQVDILTPNEREAEVLSGFALNGMAGARKAASRMRERGVRTVVLTLGARGALIADEIGARIVRGFRVRAVDTTAAGDVFNGALAVAMAEGQGIDQAVRTANAAAALSVTRLGAQRSAPARREIEKFLAAH